jgi:hypothetical protein
MALLLHPRLPSHPLRAAAHHHHAISDASCLLTLPGPGRKRTLLAAVTCRAARVKEPAPSAGASPPPPQALAKEAHKYFDHAVVTVRAGDGGHGAVLAMPPPPSADAAKPRGRFNRGEKKSKKVSYKRNYDGSVALPTGGHGGDVVVYADEAEETLLRFHEKARYCAKRGGNVGAAGGTLSSRMHSGFAGETLRIPVPVGLWTRCCEFRAFLLCGDWSLMDAFASNAGTVVKRKKGAVLADLAHPGDEVLVARGGQGGVSSYLSDYSVTLMQEEMWIPVPNSHCP